MQKNCLKILRYVVGLLILGIVITVLYSYGNKTGMFGKKHEHAIPIKWQFKLVNQEGKTIKSSDLQNKYSLVFFGFTRCPNVCPVQLNVINTLLHDLGKYGDKLNVVFITVDPEYDTVKQLHEYHERFDKRIQMFTGKREYIDELVRHYKVYVQNKHHGNINHSSIMYLIDRNHGCIDYFTFSDWSKPEIPGIMVKKLRNYLAN